MYAVTVVDELIVPFRMPNGVKLTAVAYYLPKAEPAHLVQEASVIQEVNELHTRKCTFLLNYLHPAVQIQWRICGRC